MMQLFIALISLLSILFGTDEAEIVFAGDAMMHQGQIDAARRPDGSYDFTEYFTGIKPYVEWADYAVVNLETPVSAPPYSGYPCFNAPAEYLDALKDAGFDLFLTANNHTLDRRDKGLRLTVDALDARGIAHIGTYANDSARAAALPFIRNINGIATAFLNYTYGTNGIEPTGLTVVDYIDRGKIKDDVEKARAKGAEIVIVCIHWGNEYQMLPTAGQRELADFILGLGVDAVIGGHPHVVQPFELKDNRLVVYSLGNFISNMRTRDTRGGAVVKVKLKRGDDGVARVDGASYGLVFTEPATGSRNFRLVWADESDDPRAADFARSARKVLDAHNINVAEELHSSRK